jgi:hypothetical protein
MDIANHPPLYKKKSLQDVKNRNTSPLTNDEKQRVQTVVNKFFELFMNKHL